MFGSMIGGEGTYFGYGRGYLQPFSLGFLTQFAEDLAVLLMVHFFERCGDLFVHEFWFRREFDSKRVASDMPVECRMDYIGCGRLKWQDTFG